MLNSSHFWQTIETLKKSIQERIDLEESDLAMVMPLMQVQHLDKNELLTAAGMVENKVYFIAEGVTRSFFFKDEKEISFEFYFAGSFISSYASFLMRTPSEHSIEAFTPATLLSINHADLMSLYERSRKMEQVGRIFTEELFKKSSERIKELLSLTATERYLKLLQEYPQYIRQIPLKYLASYLNITPESLSRIRKACK